MRAVIFLFSLFTASLTPFCMFGASSITSAVPAYSGSMLAGTIIKRRPKFRRRDMRELLT
jgi:hypothetical protein